MIYKPLSYRTECIGTTFVQHSSVMKQLEQQQTDSQIHTHGLTTVILVRMCRGLITSNLVCGKKITLRSILFQL